ncbi:integrase core domain-containing protein [Thermodesulfobacteriota bacterium]
MVKRDTPETKYSFCGAVAIHQELDKLGYRHKPSLSTINRVLKRNGLINKSKKTEKEKLQKKYYPEIKARHPGYLHQLDLVTPRYIKGFGVIISVNRIDVYSAQANLEQYQSKGAESVIRFIIDDWKTFGIPRYLQLDNEASFRGSLYHPRTFGKLSRFCLNFGVELVFIPFNEPWRNAHIESFNSRFDKMLWQPKVFKDLKHVRSESKKFRDKHNNYQEYRKSNFSKQKLYSYKTKYLPGSFTFDTSCNLPITRGKLHFVRLVEKDGNINILNENFYVGKNLSFQYVWAIINTKERIVRIWYQPAKDATKELIKTKYYKLREPVKNRVPIKQFC